MSDKILFENEQWKVYEDGVEAKPKVNGSYEYWYPRHIFDEHSFFHVVCKTWVIPHAWREAYENALVLYGLENPHSQLEMSLMVERAREQHEVNRETLKALKDPDDPNPFVMYKPSEYSAARDRVLSENPDKFNLLRGQDD